MGFVVWGGLGYRIFMRLGGWSRLRVRLIMFVGSWRGWWGCVWGCCVGWRSWGYRGRRCCFILIFCWCLVFLIWVFGWIVLWERLIWGWLSIFVGIMLWKGRGVWVIRWWGMWWLGWWWWIGLGMGVIGIWWGVLLGGMLGCSWRFRGFSCCLWLKRWDVRSVVSIIKSWGGWVLNDGNNWIFFFGGGGGGYYYRVEFWMG